MVWSRVYDVPEFVYFNHSIHVNKGVGCVSCHGRVDQMAAVEKATPLTMSWCLDCHRKPEQNLRPVEEVTNMDLEADGRPGRNRQACSPSRTTCTPAPAARRATDEAAMSCDENHDARAKDRLKRSLPVRRAKTADSAPQAAGAASSERDAPGRGGRRRANEFPPGASELDGVSRRNFMQLLGVSTAVATVGAACQQPNEKIVPFVRRPDEVTPGNPLHFATAYALEGYASGLLVESHEGRPTKIEGNPDHPRQLGATTASSRRCSSASTTTTAPSAAARGPAARLARAAGGRSPAYGDAGRPTAGPGCAS